MSKQFYFKQFGLALVHSLQVKTVLFQAVQFSISMHFSSIWPIDRTPGNDGNEWVLHIPQSSCITGISLSDSLVSYPEHSLERRSYHSAEMQSVYSTAQAIWANLRFEILSHSAYSPDRSLTLMSFKHLDPFYTKMDCSKGDVEIAFKDFLSSKPLKFDYKDINNLVNWW